MDLKFYLPTLPYLALNEILKNLDSEDLLNCRLVCKDWDFLAKPIARKQNRTSILLYYDNQRNLDILQHLETHEDALIPNALELSDIPQRGEETVEKICEIFRKRNSINSFRHRGIRAELFVKILKKLHSSLEILDCEGRNPLTEFEVEGAYDQSVTDMSNHPLIALRHVVLHVVNDTRLGGIIFPSAENLREVSERADADDAIVGLGRNVNILQQLQDAGRLSQIRRLSLDYLDRERMMTLISEEDLRLQELNVECIFEYEARYLEPLLEKLSSQLTHLDLQIEKYETRVGRVKFPRLEKLTHLTFNKSLVPEGLRFSRDLPNLKYLVVEEAEGDFDETPSWQETFCYDVNKGSGSKCKSLKELVIDVESMTEEQMAFLKTLFPKAKLVEWEDARADCKAYPHWFLKKIRNAKARSM